MWRGVRTPCDSLLKYPFSNELESNTVNFVPVSSESPDSLIVSVGGYGDNDTILSPCFAKVRVVPSEAHEGDFIISAASSWEAIDPDHLFVSSFHGNCVLCDVQENNGRYCHFETATNALRVEGHTCNLIDKDVSRQSQCACSLKDAIISRAQTLVSTKNSPLHVSFSQTMVLFGGINENYQPNNDMHFIRIATVHFNHSQRCSPSEVHLFILDLFAVQRGIRPSPRHRHSSCFLKGYLYLFGGDTESFEMNKFMFYRYSCMNSSWEALHDPWGNGTFTQKTSGNHCLASLTVLDSDHLVLLGGQDFENGVSCTRPNRNEALLITRIKRACFARIRTCSQNFFGFRRIPLCAVYSIRRASWKPGFSTGVEKLVTAEINGHVAFSESSHFISWCFGKENCKDDTVFDVTQDQYCSEDTDERFKGSHHGELYCFERVLCKDRWFGLRWTPSFVFTPYEKHAACESGKLPRSLYMAASCFIKVDTRGFVPPCAKGETENGILLILGGNRRHPDDNTGPVCWYMCIRKRNSR